ncbi:hypothetical protein A9Q84_18210 [Halobacteriovorax marinus]|uniref:Uncharacterized protein n=1 Tax=Halobacteriovorax marinus TaxID=97084 RepID=A0A1Y5F3B3_9BACT|nr:hypothetical protein A9Q84_18210 [Halobacteriovorax marinus]
MKSVFFQKPLEFTIDISGESWKQGENVSGSLSVKSHSGDALNYADYGIFLVKGDNKKIKKKDPKGITVIGETLLGDSDNLSFSFDLDINCPITETSSGLYIICGKKDELLEGQQMALKVLPGQTITSFIEVIENFLRFKVKSLKYKKEALEATIVVPNTKDYSKIMQFKLIFSKSEENLLLNYQFKIKSIDFSGGFTGTKDSNEEFKQVFTPKEYLSYGDSINQDFIVKKLNEIIDQVKLKPLV